MAETLNEPVFELPFKRYELLGLEGSPPEIPPLAILCSACRSILSGQLRFQPLSEKPWISHPLGLNLAQVMANTRNHECALCFLLFQTFVQERGAAFARTIPRDSNINYRILGSGTGKLGGIAFTFTHDSLPSLFEVSVLMAQSNALYPGDAGRILRWVCLPRKREASNSSQSSFTLAHHWLKICRERHSKCKVKIDFKPTRLLDLGSDDRVLRPKLILTNELSYYPDYTTLSHSWGPHSEHEAQLKLTRDNVDAFQQMIPMNRLSKTFRDAMEIAKQLKLQFLWIDSLCIIQNDENDWRQESTKMGDVYQHSSLSIAATKSRSGKGGCFTTRHPLEVTACHIEVDPQNVLPGQPVIHFLWNPNLWKMYVDESPLLSRAWVVQERVLANRILHFAHDQMFWQCNELHANEIFPSGWPHEVKKLSLDPDALHRTARPPEPEIWDKRKKYILWDRIITEYTACDITEIQKDKLTAISGIAQKIGIEQDLVAGLVRQNLPYQLLWRMSDGRHNRDGAYTAPSWSWASLNGAIKPQFLENDLHIFIRNRLYLTRGTISKLRGEEIIFLNINDGLREDRNYKEHGGELKVSGPLVRVQAEKMRDYPQYILPDERSMVVDLHDDIGTEGDSRQLNCLFILLSVFGDDFYSYGILLEPTGVVEQQYRRVGMFEQHGFSSPTRVNNTRENLQWLLSGKLLDMEGSGATKMDNSNRNILRHQVTLV